MVIPNSRLELQRQVCQIVAENLGLDPDKIFMDDDVVDDLGADSLALAELTMQLEQRMGVRVPGEEWLDVITVSQLLDLIVEVASRRLQPSLWKRGNTDFQITRGLLGVSM